MARFKLFPRNRRPSLGELLGISQAERQFSRKHPAHRVRPHVVAQDRRAPRQATGGLLQWTHAVARFLRRLFA
jgi:hypothetical protein